MNGSIQQEMTLYIGSCDRKKQMLPLSLFSLFGDMAAAHSEEIGVGFERLNERGRYWLAVRSYMIFYRRPMMNAPLRAITWPIPPARLFCNRLYRLEDQKSGEVYAEGRTQWAMMEKATNRPCRASEVYPEGFPFSGDTVPEFPSARLLDDMTEGERVGEFIPAYCDLDMANHVNNARYLRPLTDLLPCELQEKASLSFDLHYLLPCFEGEHLTVFRRREGEGYLFTLRKEDGKTALIAKIE